MNAFLTKIKNIFAINLKGLGGRILLTTFTPVVLMSLGAMFVLFNVKTISEKLDILIVNTVPALTTSKDLVIEMRTMDLNIWKVFYFKNNPDEVKAFVFDFEDSMIRFNSNLARYMKLQMPEKAEKLRTSAENKWKAAMPDFDKIKKLLQDNKTDEAFKFYESNIKIYFSDIGEILSNVEINNANIIETEDKSSKELSISVITKSIWGFGVIALLSMLFACLIVKKLMNGIGSTVEALSEAAEMIEKTGVEVKRSSHELSSATTQQAAAIEETVSSMEEMGSMLAQTVQQTQQGLIIVEEGIHETENGKIVINKLMSAMDQIDQSNDKLLKLINLIQDIQAKTKIINDIVFETRLLSFNASIEAARASVHGKGFAVVAEEIGKLATMSGKAAEEINGLLESSTKEVNSIVFDIQNKVKTGKVVSQDCEAAFNVLDVTFEKIMGSVKVIASAAKEQELGIKQTNTAMGEMEQVTQKNSKSAEVLSAQAGPMADITTSIAKSVRALNGIVFGDEDAKTEVIEVIDLDRKNNDEGIKLSKDKGRKLNRANSGWKAS